MNKGSYQLYQPMRIVKREALSADNAAAPVEKEDKVARVGTTEAEHFHRS